jgi:cysteine desulfurase/selenocysteine lyase
MHNEIDWKEYRRQFPITKHFIYLNHAAVSPLSTRVLQAIEGVSRGLEENGCLCADVLFERCDAIRASVATMINASQEEIAFTRNTTQGVLTAAMGLPWREGDTVVMPSIEFPANAYPWMGLRRFGVKLKMVGPEGGRVTAGMLAEACDDTTRLVTVSSVQFSNGYRIDLEELGDFCRGREIYLHVDGIQSLGMLDCDVSKCGIDFLSAGGHKWLLSVPGIGLFYIRQDLIEGLDIWNPGWTGVVDPWNFLDYDPTYLTEAKRYEEGSLNFHGIFALGASVDRFLEIGMDRVEARILGLSDSLERGLAERDYEIVSPRGGAERSGIICFRHPRRDTGEIFRALSEAGVIVSEREGSIRVSPHFYNTDEEIARFFEILARATQVGAGSG